MLGPGGVFIKYIFPGEDDPLFTHDVELQKTVLFGATAHHRITLAQGQNLVNYLEDLDEDTNGLRFELWSDVWDNRNNTHLEVPSEDLAKLEDNRKVLQRDQIRSRRTEKCIGSATLRMQELIGLLARVHQGHLSLKIRRMFDLPIKFHKWVKCGGGTPNLTVQVAYDRVDLTECHLLDGTVFYNFSSTSHLPLKALLEIKVLDLKINQVNFYTSIPHIDVTSIRFTLFPCNRELESKYPPIMTYLDEIAYQLKSTFTILLDVLTIKELWESYMTFEVWQHRPQNHERLLLTSHEGIWIGVAIAPCVMLLSRKQDPLNSNDVSPNGSLKVDNDLHSFLNEHAELFIADIPSELPPKRGDDDHRIDLIPRSSPLNKPPYRVSQAQQDEIMSQVNELVQKDMVRPSLSPFCSLVLLVHKKDGTYRMCVDYRALNKLTVKNRFPVPRIEDLFDELQGSTYFSRIDLKNGYHQIQVVPEDIHKTGFRTTFDLYPSYRDGRSGLPNRPERRPLEAAPWNAVSERLLLQPERWSRTGLEREENGNGTGRGNGRPLKVEILTQS
ncbi:hypothetical protein L7F22_069325 [Adiantum nelumboides]|nr:hypothetical protein [Adiantum nelumboides]